MIYQSNEIAVLCTIAGLPVWMINWNQAAIYVWSEVIQVATDGRKLSDFLDYIEAIYQQGDLMKKKMAELKSKITTWESTLKQGS